MIENLYASFVNLSHRRDRLVHMQAQLKRVGVDAVRTPGILPKDLKGDKSRYQVMINRTIGACGCYESQCNVMRDALSRGKHAFVMEDDLVFCDDFQERLKYIDEFTKTHSWDIIWGGATFHVNPPHWHTGKNPDLLGATIGRDAELTDDPRMIRTYGCFSTYAYIVNVESIEKILKLLDESVHESMGIDWLFIKLQPQLKTYSFVPGCVKQMDNKSDIGKGYTIFSGFAKLNGTIENSKYWWAKRMGEFSPESFNWAEARNK
jgi:GR25 family glycosyltransferase involved in LPS biosynthesis